MKLVIIFGPCAVGKMTVGQALEEKTGLRLFHNHMTIELVSRFFNYSSAEGKRLVHLFRREIFEAVAKSDLPGMIFTFVWALDDPADWEYIRNIHQLFESHGAEIYYVELCAGQDVRLQRNRTENRLLHNPTKRDLVWSDGNLRRMDDKYRLNSLDGEMTMEHYLRLDNTELSPDETAERIMEYFDWK